MQNAQTPKPTANMAMMQIQQGSLLSIYPAILASADDGD